MCQVFVAELYWRLSLLADIRALHLLGSLALTTLGVDFDEYIVDFSVFYRYFFPADIYFMPLM